MGRPGTGAAGGGDEHYYEIDMLCVGVGNKRFIEVCCGSFGLSWLI